MDINDIRTAVAEIEANKDDNEDAHISEDALFVNFVNHVASHASGELAEMAKEVLKAKEVKFRRWHG